MIMNHTKLLSLINLLFTAVSGLSGDSKFVVPSDFPSSVFANYYVKPGPNSQPQPAIFDPILNITFPFNLTDPKNIPTHNDDPIYFPPGDENITNSRAEELIGYALLKIQDIMSESSEISDSCSKCMAGLSVGKYLAQRIPTFVPDVLVSLCQSMQFASDAVCQAKYAASRYGATWTQVLALADVTGLDGKYICATLSRNWCDLPSANPLNTTGLFPKPKPTTLTKHQPSGKRVKVLHLSDFHLDPRYEVGSEAVCTSGLCCRHSENSTSQVNLPAPLYGAYRCDTPYYLALAALQSLGPLTGTGSLKSSPAWTLYTGDLVSHDKHNQLSREYVEYTETSVYGMMKSFINGPVFAVLGNHDSNPDSIDAPHSMPGPLGQQFSWNYDHVSSLWKNNGWIDEKTANQASTHYAAYSVKNHHGLRIITMNTDFWYKNNFLNLINTTNPDVSGLFDFMIKELQSAEDAGERVWITGHILSGWDGAGSLPNPSNLFYQIVDRYSPHVISNIFWGHSHEDQFSIYYKNNGTIRDSSTALTTGWIGPSITPLHNMNSGYRMYEVDTGNFEIYEAYTYFSNVSSYQNLGYSGPTFEFEYSTREAYGSVIGWPEDAPLNATFWHSVTEAMETNKTLVSQFNTYQGKSSDKSPACTSKECGEAKICYMRSGSESLSRACPKGFSSVQSPYSGRSG